MNTIVCCGVLVVHCCFLLLLISFFIYSYVCRLSEGFRTERSITIMSRLCPCFRRETPTPLDAPYERGANIAVSTPLDEDVSSTRRILAFAMYDFRCPNFDFLPVDNGEFYIATFRASKNKQVMGAESDPIPKAVFEKFQITKKKKQGITYCIYMETGGEPISPYFRPAGLDNIKVDPIFEARREEGKRI